MLIILQSSDDPGVLRWNPGATRATSSHQYTNSGEVLNSLAAWPRGVLKSVFGLPILLVSLGFPLESLGCLGLPWTFGRKQSFSPSLFGVISAVRCSQGLGTTPFVGD